MRICFDMQPIGDQTTRIYLLHLLLRRLLHLLRRWHKGPWKRARGRPRLPLRCKGGMVHRLLLLWMIPVRITVGSLVDTNDDDEY